MSKRGRRGVSILLSTAIIISGMVFPMENTNAEGENNYGVNNPRVEYNYHESIIMGKYWTEDTNSDYNIDNNDEMVPITWQILKRYDDGTALVLSDEILSLKHFNEDSKSVTWENCSLRKWLNEDFYNNAFSDAEKKLIEQEELVNSDNDTFNVNGGNETQDKVFLLSIDDITNESYGYDNDFEVYDPARKAKSPFIYGDEGFHVSSEGCLEWWLRSPGCDSNYFACVNCYGAIDDAGFRQNDGYRGVRPAMRIILNDSIINYGKNINLSVKSCEWDTIFFGKYNGQALRWNVLNVDGSDAFLLLDKAIIRKPYNDKLADITWENCSLRKWLNGDFYDNCFSDSEKKFIKDTINVNNYNRYVYGNVSGGNNTTDKVFLLSVDEATDWSYGFPAMFHMRAQTRVVLDSEAQRCWWWLRSPGWTSKTTIGVDANGHVCDDGEDVDSGNAGVRPAIHINLESLEWEKGIPIIIKDYNSETPVPTSNPTSTPTSIPTPTVTPILSPSSQPTQSPTQVPTSKPTEVAQPTSQPTVSATPTATPSPVVAKDKVTTFSIKNKAKVKKTAKIKIKDKDKIKKITLNGKTIKIKKNKTSFTLKLKSYKKALKKKGKWNTLKVTDKKGNVKSIKFKTK